MSYLPTPKQREPKLPKVRAPRAPKIPSEKLRAVNWGLWAVGAAFVIALAASVYFAFTLVRNLVTAGSGGLAGIFSPAAQTTNAAPGITPPPGLLAGPTPKPWNGIERVTVLVMGLDYRDTDVNDGPSRTDTMMLVSYDPLSQNVGILSIPRDLWVEIPGFGFDKINKAYFDAESYRLPGGGPALAMQTVQNLLGVPIDYYAVLDFGSFMTFIDEIGGIDVDVQEEELRIDPVGPGNTIRLHRGRHHLNGAAALAYARSRSSEGGDFDRARRQQEVIFAVRDKILSLENLPLLIAKAPNLWNTAMGGVRTNLTIDDILSLGWSAKSVARENIRNGTIGPDQLQSIQRIDELDVLIPDLEKVRALRDTIFTSAGSPGPVTPVANPADLAPKEGAKIEILNGSGVPGLAGATKDYLVRMGLPEANISVGDAAGYYPSTTIIDFSGMPYTVRFLVELMRIAPGNNLSQVSLQQGVDVQLILGGDWSVPAS
jgi:polyisoprenyl-teichoic acid--peptidoglycan teichoic acid transferase